jgi:protein disulfide-isomerase A6
LGKKGGKSKSSSSSGGSSGGGGGGGGSGGASGGDDKDVTVLTSANFDDVVMNSKDIWMVEFYAPWCGHCKALEPEWNIAATKLKGQVKLGKMDVDDATNKPIGARFGVQGFPTIKVFGYGEKSDSKASDY